MEMQQNLVKINIQLKEQKQRALQSRIDEFDAKYKEQLAQRTALQKKDADLQRIMDGEPQAWKAMQESRNSDKKQYKKVEDAQRTLKDKRERKAEIDAILAGTAPQPAYTDATVERPDPKALAAESVVLSAAIPQLEEKIGYLKQGYTEDAVDAYFRAKDTASRAKKDREALATQLTAVASQIAATIAKSSEYSAQLDAVNRDSGLDGLPPIFQWPVRGNITARYYDPDYVAVFGVPHKAIDIAVPQGTPVKSVSEGVVFAVKLGGATGMIRTCNNRARCESIGWSSPGKDVTRINGEERWRGRSRGRGCRHRCMCVWCG
jgi:murein DD-endopeptidase MepM/ murein hydrolase activator NlpD